MKGQKTGGRTKGTLNKSTAEVKAYAQKFTKEAIDKLRAIMNSAKASPQAQVAAAKEILDRAVGKATQPISGAADEPPVRFQPDLSNLTDEEIAILERLAGSGSEPF